MLSLIQQVILGKLSWQMKAYSYAVRGQDGGSAKKEEILRNTYPPLDKNISSNITVTDNEGKVVAWLLPDLLSQRVQVGTVSHVKKSLTADMRCRSTPG
jgi:hypothetical protein